MFSIARAVEDYTWPVDVYLPTNGGKTEKQSFTAKFKKVSRSRFDAIREEILAGTISDVKIATEVLVGWSDIVDGDEVEYSENAKARLLDIPVVAASVVRAFFEGYKGAPIKN